MSDSSPSIRYWAVVARGLEPVAHEELRAHDSHARDIDIAYRRVAWTTPTDARELLALRTLDDLFVDLQTWERVDHRRFALQAMGEQAMLLDLRDAAALCRDVRDLGTPPSFSVTVNFVGRRNYSTDEIKQVVASAVSAGHGYVYEPNDAVADLNVRVFIEHERAYLGIRLAAAPLHERAYKVAQIAGSLRPTVAAAMIRLSALPAAATLLDPLCGAGTIPIEAALIGLRAIAGDAEQQAIDSAQRNQAEAGAPVTFHTWDARSTGLDGDSVDGVVCNLPWGRQIEIEAITPFYHDCLREMSRVTRPGGRLVLLSSLQPLLRAAAASAGLDLVGETEISLSGQTPVISVLSKPGT